MAEKNFRQHVGFTPQHEHIGEGGRFGDLGADHRSFPPAEESDERAVVPLDVAQADSPMEMADTPWRIVTTDGHGLPAADKWHAGFGSFPTASVRGLA